MNDDNISINNIDNFKKKIIIALFFGIIFIVVFMCLQFWEYNRIVPYTDDTFAMDENTTINYSIDDIQYNSSYIVINGWCFKQGENLVVVRNNFLLRDTETQDFYRIQSAAEERGDITAHFNDGFNYDHCGLQGKVSKAKLDLLNHKYEIYILYQSDGNNIVVNTNKIIEGVVE